MNDSHHSTTRWETRMTRLIALSVAAMVLVMFTAPRATAAVTDDLVAYYDFETDLGNQVGVDSLTLLDGGDIAGWSGGTVTRGDGSSTRTTLLVGNAGNYVDVDNDRTRAEFGATELGDSFAISAWYYLAPNDSNGSDRFFVFEGSTNFDVSYGISSGDTYGSHVGQTFVESTVTSRNAWHHVLHNFTSDGTNTTLDVYIDGVLEDSGSVSTSAVDFSAIHFGLSRSGVSPDRDWDGLLDEVALWDRALTTDEIAIVRARGLNGQALTIPAPAALPFGLGLLGLLAARRRR